MLSAHSATLNLIALLASLLSPTYASTPSIWGISIDNSPAPPPDKGPPLSAKASRDPALLKYQVAGIVAAYIFCLCIVTVLVTYRRRLRRKQLSSDQSLSMEMVKPAANVNQAELGTGPSFISPQKEAFSPRKEAFRPWVSPGQGHQYKQSLASISTVDEKVVEAHKARDMDDLEKLYAAVLLQDEESSYRARIGSYGDQTQTSSFYSQNPTELQHVGNIGQAVPLSPTSPVPGVSPTPIEEQFQTTTTRSSPPPPPKTVKVAPVPLSLTGHARIDSNTSTRSRPSRISVRGRQISTPMGSADLRESAAYSDEAPLSPRIYTPGPPPPTPGHKSAAAQAREIDGQRRSKFHLPSALSISGRTTTATNSTGSLPFRQNYSDSMRSAPATKTTFVDKREISSGPKTGVPFTPYSPYMPYTPLTPVTPRVLVGKEERKRKQKKAALKVVSEDDLVADDDDMWSTVR